MTEFKIAVMEGVREHTECALVELSPNEAGTVVTHSYNECGNNYTDVDLADLFDWARAGLPEGAIQYGRGVATLSFIERN